MIRFIDEYRNRFSVEFICKTLKDNRAGGFITSRGYHQSKARGLSARRLRDAVLVDRIRTVHRDNYGVYGEVSQVLFRLSRWENLEHAKEI